MQHSSLNKPPQKVKNILTRHSCSKEARLNSSFESPEKHHLLKYAPKYYHTLSLEVTNSIPLQSKIKKTKKLKNFRGYFKEVLPQKLWLNLLANTRKEIEEVPKIAKTRSNFSPSPLFWARLTLWKVKFFPNITRAFFPTRKPDYTMIQDYDKTSLIRKPFLGYLGNMRKIKTLEMLPDQADNEGERGMTEKLNRMSQFIKRLENLTFQLSPSGARIQELLMNKDTLSHITSLTFSPSLKFDRNFVTILQLCKNLKFLSVRLRWGVNDAAFPEFLASIHSLPELAGFEFDLPRDLKKYWSSLKLRASLRFLKLGFDISDLAKAGIVGNKEKLGHWEDLKELEKLELSILCKKIDDLVFLRTFITMVLKKASKLKSFKCSVYSDSKLSDPSLTGEPFAVEEVPHLYESLEKFEYILQNSKGHGSQVRFDLKKMRAFRSLKEFKLDGNGLCAESIEEMVSLLEENKKEGDYPALEISLEFSHSTNWLIETLEKIKRVKRPGGNLKMEMNLKFRINKVAGDELRLLGEYCHAIKPVGPIKGLTVRFGFYARDDFSPVSVEALREVMSAHREIRNLVIELSYLHVFLQYRKIDGEREQLFKDDYEM